ncbi:BamA/TamA family outer membrane protein [Anabaena cylindrica FACHB-243]|uniref:Surface antigen (D15) n=1 Tax=Anabaena cylindrica (strain ATCC 27899 / PCC 7122) TaxID=272123 RepID=K9ZDV7_ANACC|nr:MULTISPECIES: BamA/TamA family outer membrane protein [Anabaena]AFZ57366.1 surface antigen (D15) [Anabaena cylindrica PCC 7122]MBD2421047.1 BamA/TamA family outer membrane protein [Anabaena cylindrica FACHB-243]MBY5280751.1 BamA/TamA family outer membrane protein [Anabaena sp. CCAP 1446/1C]MBY5306382.1 BamA/TamA family outer membrane protein [Anabaena sp. CCAP 1446/1C]MCM2405799.1 BamA/TamA family outer membrane protein [Anabaena sp. CCAP 1446/1C]
MRVSSAAIFTLATLVASNITQKANAVPAQTTNQEEANATSDVIVVPFVETQTAQVETVASPETTYAIEFSSQPVVVPNNINNNFTTDNNLVVIATNVQIVGANPELEQIIRKVIKTQTGGNTSQTQLQKDVTAILDTGLFASANVNSSSTSAGLNVVYQVKPVVVQALQLSGAKVLNYKVALESFQSQIGKDISPAQLQQIVQKINQWYTENGYTLGRVLSIKPSPQGVLTVNVAEGLVADVKFRFLTEEGEKVDSKGNPVKGRTQTEFLRQQLKLQPGQVFQDKLAQQDVQSLYKLGLFKTVNVAFEGDASKADLIYELQEVGARSVNLGGGYNADDGISVIVSYKDQNVGGVNDTLAANIEVNRQDVLFNTNFNSPYRATTPDRFGYNIKTFRRRELSDTFDDTIKLENGDKVREGRIGGGVSIQQEVDGWDASLGLNYTRVSIRDREGNITPKDANNNQLSFSGNGIDDLTTVSFTATKDERDNPNKPTQGSLLSFTTEQSVPVGQGQISMNRLRGNYSQFMPVNLFNSNKPQVFALNLQAGTVIGDLPPYETFNLGGSNSVRGYDAGKVASGRSYVLASAEYRFPIFPIAGGVLFADFASDLGSGDTVIGDPAGVRNKPGNGFGYGAGVRVDSPLGLIRADYGINDQGDSRVHIGIGQRF